MPEKSEGGFGRALGGVGVPPETDPGHAPGPVEMGLGSFDAFAAGAQGVSFAGAPDPPPIGTPGVVGSEPAAPAPLTAAWIRQVATQPEVGQRDLRRRVAGVGICAW